MMWLYVGCCEETNIYEFSDSASSFAFLLTVEPPAFDFVID